MVSKQIIQEKLNHLTKEQLEQVEAVIEQLSNAENQVKRKSLMSKLQQISIEAPEDFSVQVARSLGRDISE